MIRFNTIFSVLFIILFFSVAYTANNQENNENIDITMPDVLNKERPDIIGIDISHYQESIDWDKVEEYNAKFVFIKISEGATLNDKKAQDHWQEAKKIDILIGGYHFFIPSRDPKLQAELFIKNLKKNDLTNMLPPVLDIEVWDEEYAESFFENITIWLNTVEQSLGCKPIIYSNVNFWHTYLDKKYKNYDLWLAEYDTELSFKGDLNRVLFWQFGDSIKVNGIKKNIDLNKFLPLHMKLDDLICKPIESNE